MTRVARKYLLFGLILCFILLVLAIAVFRFESYRIDKIDFIVRDNQHENVANFSGERLAITCSAAERALIHRHRNG